MEVSGQLQASASLFPRKNIPYPFYRKLGRLQSQSGRRGEEKNSCPYRKSNPCHPAPSLVTYTDWGVPHRTEHCWGRLNYENIAYILAQKTNLGVTEPEVSTSILLSQPAMPSDPQPVTDFFHYYNVFTKDPP